MALKSKITDKAEFDKLADVLKAEYKEENGVYLLQSDDANELRTAKDREAERARTAEAERDRLKAEKADAEKAIQDAKDEAARKAGDVTSIEESYKGKLATQKSEHDAEVKRLKSQIEDLTIGVASTGMAAEISIAPDLMEPIIRKRLKLETDGDKAVVRVLDAEGKASALSLDDLKKEFTSNPKYATVIKGSDASGGGAHGNNPGGGALPTGKKFSSLTLTERTALHAKEPAKFNQYVEQSRKGVDPVVA